MNSFLTSFADSSELHGTHAALKSFLRGRSRIRGKSAQADDAWSIEGRGRVNRVPIDALNSRTSVIQLDAKASATVRAEFAAPSGARRCRCPGVNRLR
jgi:hypothetical protein